MLQPGQMLVAAAELWLREKGAAAIRGPINPVAENWGFVLEGYDSEPVYLSPWNPAYYHDFFTSSGYTKAKDLLVYEADLMNGYQLPERYAGFMEKISAALSRHQPQASWICAGSKMTRGRSGRYRTSPWLTIGVLCRSTCP